MNFEIKGEKNHQEKGEEIGDKAEGKSDGVFKGQGRVKMGRCLDSAEAENNAA